MLMFDEVFLTFQECAKRGSWDPILDPSEVRDVVMASMAGYRSRGEDAEIWLVRHDGLKRAFHFRPGTQVWIGNGMIRFYGFQRPDEIAVDEDERAGKPPLSKL